jgi:rubrerythrin
MDITDYSNEELLLTAIKSEVEAYQLYTGLAEKVESGFLVDRLRFIAGEEVKHRKFLESLFRMNYPEEKIGLPEKSEIPLPEVKIPPGQIMVSEVISQAMDAEKAASDFYLALSELYKHDDETRRTLRYLSDMEMGHYNLLETENRRLREEENYEIEWELMHAGP